MNGSEFSISVTIKGRVAIMAAALVVATIVGSSVLVLAFNDTASAVQAVVDPEGGVIIPPPPLPTVPPAP